MPAGTTVPTQDDVKNKGPTNDTQLDKKYANPLNKYLNAKLAFKVWKALLSDKTIVEEVEEAEDSDENDSD